MNEPHSSIKTEAGGEDRTSQSEPSSSRQDTTADSDDPYNPDKPDKPDKPVGQNLLQSEDKSKRSWWQRIIGGRKKDATKIRADLAGVLAQENLSADGFTIEEKTMINNVLRLQHIRVEDVMKPRVEIEAIDIDTGLGDLLKAFVETGHSRLPVYADTMDDPRGMVHIRDIVAHITQTAGLNETEVAARKRPLPGNLDLKKVTLTKPLGELNLLREILFVPPSMLASDLMGKMQATHIQIALVIDEYGGTDGLVSLEDLVEVVVGDIEDEHDEDDAYMIIEKGEGIFIFDARAELDDIVERVGNGFKIGEFGEDVDTIGGLIFAIIGRVPVRGEVIEALGYEFRVIDADPRRIKKIEMERSRKRNRLSS